MLKCLNRHTYMCTWVYISVHGYVCMCVVADDGCNTRAAHAMPEGHVSEHLKTRYKIRAQVPLSRLFRFLAVPLSSNPASFQVPYQIPEVRSTTEIRTADAQTWCPTSWHTHTQSLDYFTFTHTWTFIQSVLLFLLQYFQIFFIFFSFFKASFLCKKRKKQNVYVKYAQLVCTLETDLFALKSFIFSKRK